MDRRVVIAAALSVLILLGWSWLFPPPPPPERAEPPAAETLDAAAPAAAPEPEPPPEAIVPVEAVGAPEEVDLLVENDLFAVRLTNRGGIATSWQLTDSTTAQQKLELLPQLGSGEALTLGVELDDAALAAELNAALWQVERTTVEGGERVEFTWADGQGVSARKTLTFSHGGYVVSVEVEVTDRGRRQPARLVVGPGFGEQGLTKKGTYYYESVLWNQAGRVTHVYKKKLGEEPGGVDAAVRWAGLEDQYFAALVVPAGQNAGARWRAVERAAVPAAAESAAPEPLPLIAVAVPAEGARLFVGPKRYRLLEGLGFELEKAVWFSSSGALAWIARGILFGLLWIHDHTLPNYGLAVVLCTFLLRLLLFPVNQYSMVSMKKTQLQMQRLAPKIKAIKAKYSKKKDAETRARMNQEMMDLYKQEGVNPMGGVSGCLPLLAQIPILMAFYFMLTVAVELRGAPFFGWITDLSAPEPLIVKPLPLLMGITMFVQQKMAMSKVKDPVQQQQQKMMMIMPFVFTWICFQMPAGMVLYWFVNNLLGIGQQWLVNRHTTRLEAAALKA
jgi:YidC/Oxa1 family membrane protein insertase